VCDRQVKSVPLTVEPVFGIIKEQFGLRQFLLRGQAKVRSMWRLTCAVFNLMKIYRNKVDLKALMASDAPYAMIGRITNGDSELYC
jgi:hypothetical protein